MTEQKINRWHFSSSIIGNPVFPQWKLYDNVSNVIAIVQPVRDQYDEAKAFMYMAVAAPLMLEVLQAVKVCPYCTFSDWSSGTRQHMKHCTLAAAILAAIKGGDNNED